MTTDKKRKRILHVDDDADVLEVVKTILEKEGYEVVSVKDGTKALKKINLNNFDLLLLDIMMPDMSGWDLFSRIVKVKSTYKVIFLTVLEISGVRLKELKKHGIQGYISKPFKRDDLVRKVKKTIDSSKQ